MTVEMAFRDRESACSPKITNWKEASFSRLIEALCRVTKIYFTRKLYYTVRHQCDDIVRTEFNHILADVSFAR